VSVKIHQKLYQLLLLLCKFLYIKFSALHISTVKHDAIQGIPFNEAFLIKELFHIIYFW
jgi:hypothetical protein